MSKLPYANKDLGQHFLTNRHIIESICSDFSNEAKGLVEVGPGPAVLTKELAKLTLPFFVIEKDKRFLPYLAEYIKEEQVILGDALKCNLSDLLQERGMHKDIWLVSNLPYNISSQLLVKFLRSPEISMMTLMFQKEVGDKVLGAEKNGMNSLCALSQTFFDVKKLSNVPPGAFSPPPKVDSIVLSFKRIESELKLEVIDQYENFLRRLFANRRKQIGSVYKKTDLLEIANIDRTRRAETLNLQEVLLLFKTELDASREKHGN